MEAVPEASPSQGALKLIVMGAPASGKGTICERLVAEYGCVHLSTGDMLRAAVAEGSELGVSAKGYMDSGGLVPDDIIVGVVLQRLQQPDCASQGWLLDGFPRTAAQADALLSNHVRPHALIFVDVPDELLIRRVVGRRLDPETGKVYHVEFSPPPSEDIAARLTQRTDDTEETARVRLETFHASKEAILSKFNDVTVRVDGAKPKDEVWESVRSHIELEIRRFQVIFVLGGPGAGKGTQGTRAGEEFHYQHMSAGDLLRAERSSGSALAEEINAHIAAGTIVPASVTTGLLLRGMRRAFAQGGTRHFLIDGFPRNAENLLGWHQTVGEEALVRAVLFFDCPEEVMQERLLERGKTSGRIDDNLEAIVRRFRTFQEESMPVVHSWARLGRVKFIGADRPPEEVYADVSAVMEGLRAFMPPQRTLAMIKPDAVAAGHVGAILEAIASAGLVVVAAKLAHFDDAHARVFYAEHDGKSFFPTLLDFMTSGACVGLVLEGPNAVRRWRKLMGPTNTERAREEAPSSLRGLYGTDGTRNATHGSDSDAAAMREIDLWFGPGSLGAVEGPAVELLPQPVAPVPGEPPYGLALEETLAIIKPSAIEHITAIKGFIATNGFAIVQEARTQLTARDVEKLYAEHSGKPFYEPLCKYMSSGPIVALRLRREAAVDGWRAIMGPANVEEAKRTHPTSPRALYGTDNLRNAVHGSERSVARREIGFFFSPSGR